MSFACRFTTLQAGMRMAAKCGISCRSGATRPALWETDALWVALTDAAVGQGGGFRCVPSLYRERARWPKAPVIDADGDETWLADTQGHQIEAVSAQTGDLIIWDYRLPHGNSWNNSAPPRIAFYVSMYPTSDDRLRRAAIESWKTGHCVPWWRNRPGYDRVEPSPPAALTNLGRRLIGPDGW
jgi:hypothetical protein